jgi:hypothetical protein
MSEPKLSKPTILFWDTTLATPAYVTITLPRPGVGGFSHKPHVARNSNRVESGATQTDAYHELDYISYQSDFITDLIASELRRLWRSTRARETFTLKRHGSLTTEYPSDTYPIYANEWEASWKIGYDDLNITPSNAIRGLWSVTMEFEAVATEVP